MGGAADAGCPVFHFVGMRAGMVDECGHGASFGVEIVAMAVAAMMCAMVR